MSYVKITGIRDTKAKLNEIEGYVKNPRKSLKESIEYMKRTTEGEVFSSEGSSMGRKWARLNSAYQAVKAKRYPGKGILQATGKMRKSFKTRVGSTKAVLSNSDSKFKYHQLGTRKMPQRVMLFIDAKRERKVLKIFEDDSQKVISK